MLTVKNIFSRRDIELSCQSFDTVMILNYSRRSFNQTGTGHFAPLGGYDKDGDMILILDCARFKFPPHWVPVSMMWQSIQSLAVNGKGQTDGKLIYLSTVNDRLNALFLLNAPFE